MATTLPLPATVAKLIAVEKPKEKRRFGTLKGLGQVIDPHWADPMTEQDLKKLIEGFH
jgi:hypothetical protein